MLKPDKDDPTKIRRTWAFLIAIYAFLIQPNLLIGYYILFEVEISLLKAVLTYIGTLAVGPIGAYLYAAHKNGNRER